MYSIVMATETYGYYMHFPTHIHTDTHTHTHTHSPSNGFSETDGRV